MIKKIQKITNIKVKIKIKNKDKTKIKNISRLLRGITSNYHGDFYCLGCLHSFRTDSTLKKHERFCDDHDYCEIVMSKKDKNILRYNHGEKSLKVAHIIYAYTESLLIKHQSSHQSYTEKKSTHEACGYSMGMVTSYDRSKSIHKYYRGKDCTEKFLQ